MSEPVFDTSADDLQPPASDWWSSALSDATEQRRKTLAAAQAEADRAGRPVRAVVRFTIGDQTLAEIPVGWGLPSDREWIIAVMPDGTEEVMER